MLARDNAVALNYTQFSSGVKRYVLVKHAMKKILLCVLKHILNMFNVDYRIQKRCRYIWYARVYILCGHDFKLLWQFNSTVWIFAQFMCVCIFCVILSHSLCCEKILSLVYSLLEFFVLWTCRSLMLSRIDPRAEGL